MLFVSHMHGFHERAQSSREAVADLARERDGSSLPNQSLFSARAGAGDEMSTVAQVTRYVQHFITLRRLLPWQTEGTKMSNRTPSLPLTPAERTELARMLRDPERFHSDGREVMWACVTIPLLSIPILIVLFKEARSTIRLYYADRPLDLGVLSTSPELLGFIALLVVAIGCAVYGALTFRRHGVVITTFGVARVRGGVKKLIRFSEIDTVNFSERRLPTHRVRTDELEVKAKKRPHDFVLWVRRPEIQAAHRTRVAKSKGIDRCLTGTKVVPSRQSNKKRVLLGCSGGAAHYHTTCEHRGPPPFRVLPETAADTFTLANYRDALWCRKVQDGD
jgi:hypothetical protein